MSSPPKKSGTESATDFQSLAAAPDYDPAQAAKREREQRRQRTDYQSLAKDLPPDRRRYQHRTLTDHLIDALTPLLVFLMTYSVIFFLLDIRFIYTEVHDQNLRWVAFFFLVGIVALNRLVARDGSEESMLYIAGLAVAIGIYTFATTGAYGVGSVAGGFLNSPGWATLFNMTVVAAVWWVTNRLVHECSIDENKTAGDIGILTGTLRNFRQAVQREPTSVQSKQRLKKQPGKRYRAKDHILEDNELEAVDPLEWKERAEAKREPAAEAPSERPSQRHPGVSIFYFSVPVMAIFALGLPVLMRGGPTFILAGHFYVGLFTLCALMLLMLTSLSGLREYFRNRRIHLPAGIGPFWVGLGVCMIAVVMIGALQLPKPPMPAAALVDEHQIDYWSRGSTFELEPVAATAAERLQQSRVIERISQAVLAVMALFVLFGLVRGIGAVAAAIGRRRDLYPQWVVNLFNALDRLLERIVSLPEPKPRRRPVRVSAANAKSTPFRNPMAGEGAEDSAPADVTRYIAFTYDALCALADDLGVPRHRDQTPYEFVRSLPRELRGLKEDAEELTDLYVRSAYSPVPPEPKVLDKLRKFWMNYERVRRRYIR